MFLPSASARKAVAALRRPRRFPQPCNAPHRLLRRRAPCPRPAPLAALPPAHAGCPLPAREYYLNDCDTNYWNYLNDCDTGNWNCCDTGDWNYWNYLNDCDTGNWNCCGKSNWNYWNYLNDCDTGNWNYLSNCE